MGRFSNDNKEIKFTYNGQDYSAREGDSIATALFENDIRVNRKTFGKQNPRGSFCFMGVCFECLVKVNGKSGVQGCKHKVEESMEIKEDA